MMNLRFSFGPILRRRQMPFISYITSNLNCNPQNVFMYKTNVQNTTVLVLLQSPYILAIVLN